MKVLRAFSCKVFELKRLRFLSILSAWHLIRFSVFDIVGLKNTTEIFPDLWLAKSRKPQIGNPESRYIQLRNVRTNSATSNKINIKIKFENFQ